MITNFFGALDSSFYKTKRVRNESISELMRIGFLVEKQCVNEIDSTDFTIEHNRLKDDIRNCCNSMKVENKCYYVSDEFIEEALKYIIELKIKEGYIEYDNKIAEYNIRNEGFNQIDLMRTFYKNIKNQLIEEKIEFRKHYVSIDYNTVENVFSENVINFTKQGFQHSIDFNYAYLVGDKEKMISRSNFFSYLSKMVRHTLEFVYVSEQLGKKDIKNINRETYTTLEAVCLLFRLGILYLEDEVSYSAQARIISKLINKHPANIREAMALLDKSKHADKLTKALIKIDKDLNEAEYPFE